MKIIELKAENIKNLKVIDIKPDGSAVVLTGKNGAGKSAVLDSIFMALTGEKIEDPIRKGEARAEISVDLDKFIVKKIFTEKGARLEVWNKDGAQYASPQTLLNNIIGELSFDPLEFKNMKPSEQRELLIKLAGIDFKNIDSRIAQEVNNRTILNREFKKIESVFLSMQKPEPNTVLAEISIQTQLQKISDLEGRYNAFKEYQTEIQDSKARIEANIEEIDELQSQIESLKRQNLEIQRGIEEMKRPQEVSIQEIEKEKKMLGEIEQINRKAREAKQYQEISEMLQKAKANYEGSDESLAALRQEKNELVKSAKFPLSGLGVNDESVIFSGIPFSQLSTGEQIGVSTAIAMKLNPKLKVLFVRDGSLLDQSGFQAILEAAKDCDYQVWIEKVSDSGEVGIFIEEGEIKAIDGQPVNKTIEAENVNANA